MGMKRRYVTLYCHNGHRRYSENTVVRPNGHIRCMDCERANKRRCRYGMNEKTWNAVFESQGRCCAVCRRSNTKTWTWHTDHSHKTGRFRGILCDGCNRALGAVQDDINVLLALVDYLKRTELGDEHGVIDSIDIGHDKLDETV